LDNSFFPENNSQGVAKDIVDLLNMTKIEVKQCGFSYEFEECYDDDDPMVRPDQVNQTLSLSLSSFDMPEHVLVNQKKQCQCRYSRDSNKSIE